ncbi:polysaccharide pyruvyl transferase family protein [Oceanicaulis sp.]|uniref:polysaccharide pyruvyl transferase family protein n=1 Tax=Oceanicaulis sp. TaxID=1924941 RepID=UPI003BAD07CF
MKRVLIVNAYGRSNRGDSVLLDECIAEIREALPTAELSGVLFEGLDDARRVHPDVVWTERIGNSHGRLHRILTLVRLSISLLAISLPGFRFERLLPKYQAETVKQFRQSDIVVSAPGGYIHDTNFAYYIAIFHIYLAVFLGKTVVLAPQSIGPINGRFGRFAAKKVLSQVKYICTREGYSYNFLIGLGLDTESIYQTGDSAFWNEDVLDDDNIIGSALAEIGVVSNEKIIGMTCVDWKFPQHQHPNAAKQSYLNSMAQIADFVYSVYGLRSVIFNQVNDDISAALEIQKRASSPVLVDRIPREPNTLRALIRKSQIFIGTRFHSCIFALCLGRPTIAVSYLPKTEFIMKDLGLSHRVLNIDDLELQVAERLIRIDLADLAAAEVEIAGAVNRYRKKFKRLSAVINLIQTS